MKNKKPLEKWKINLKKTDKLHKEFIKKIRDQLKIPTVVLGVIVKKDGTPKFLEVVIKRPERYTCPNLIKQIPKKYKGFKVKVF